VRRWRRIILLTISMTICTAVLLMWERSISTGDTVSYCEFFNDHSEAALFSIMSYEGILNCHKESRAYWQKLGVLSSGGNHHWSWEIWGTDQFKSAGGVKSWRDYWFAFNSNDRFIAIIIPYWSIVLLSAIYPIVYLAGLIVRKRRRSKRIASGLCLNCGYDLQGKGGRCPECGAAQSAQQTLSGQ
jgi:hypothetical protein